MTIVDAMNVIGSRPDGWWRDRRGAMARLATALRERGEPACVVFDGDPWPGAPESGEGLEVCFAGRGRDAADREIVRRVEAAAVGAGVRVVTSDGALAACVAAAGAEVVGAGAFRQLLDGFERGSAPRGTPEDHRP